MAATFSNSLNRYDFMFSYIALIATAASIAQISQLKRADNDPNGALDKLVAPQHPVAKTLVRFREMEVEALPPERVVAEEGGFPENKPARSGVEIRDLAGEWKITYGHGSVRVYIFDEDGKMRGNLEDSKWISSYKLTGQIERRDGMLLLTFNEEDKLERLTLGSDGRLKVEHFDPKADFPAKQPRVAGIGIRRKATTPVWESAPSVEIRDLAGEWTIIYGHGGVRIYTFDKGGKMRGTANDVKLTGQIERRDGRLLLTFNEEDKLERLTLRHDRRLAVEHFDPRGDYPEKQPGVVGLGTPVSGKYAPGVDLLDAVMLKYMNGSGLSAAALAVGRGRDAHILYSRGYGWSDDDHKLPLHADTPMGLASCDKHLTASAIKQLARSGNLSLNDSVLKLLEIKPAGKIIDRRVWDITLQHLLDSSAGWQGEPVDRAWQAANGTKFPIESETLLSYVMVQELAWTPGTKSLYDSFGYNSLKCVVAKVSGKSYVDYLRHDLCAPYGVKELRWIRQGARQKGEPPQLWNGLIMEDPEKYRMCVSMPALCTTMRCFFQMGDPRDDGSRNQAFGGSWSNISSGLQFRGDGINICYSFNGSKLDLDKGFEVELFEAIDQLIEEKRLRLPQKSRH